MTLFYVCEINIIKKKLTKINITVNFDTNGKNIIETTTVHVFHGIGEGTTM
jgi:hypothetical protein